MKTQLLVLTLLLSVVNASGQPHHNPPRDPAPHEVRRHDDRGPHRRHHDVPPPPRDRHHRDHHRDNHRHGRRADVLCIRDWQELWNGCYVRVNQFGISIVDRRDHRIVRGDEIILLANGHYMVRSGGFWRVYTARGDRLGNVWGDSIELVRDGLFRCIRAGIIHYYDLDGHERHIRSF